MKRIIVVLAALALLLPSAFVSVAAGTVSFEAESISCANNRLAEVAFTAHGSGKLCAALFTVTFDSSVLEFREAKAAKGSRVEINPAGESVKISYLCSDGIDLSGQAELFTLTFKSCSEGVSEIAYSVFDCVDSQVESMSIGSCVSGSVTVTPNAGPQSGAENKTGSSASKSSSAAASSKSSKKKKRTSSSGIQETTEESITDLGNINHVIQADFDKITPMIVLCLSIVIAAAFICFIVLRLKSIKKNDKSDDNAD